MRRPSPSLPTRQGVDVLEPSSGPSCRQYYIGALCGGDVRLLEAVLLLGAVAGLVALPALADNGAHAAPSDPGMIVVAGGPAPDRIYVYHPNGTPAFSRQLGDYHRGPYGPVTVGPVTVGPDGRFAVATGSSYTLNSRIHVFPSNSTHSFDIDIGYNNNASDIALGPDGRIVVADGAADRIWVFHPHGGLAFDIGSHHGARSYARFDGPTDVAVGSDGRIAVVETGSYRI